MRIAYVVTAGSYSDYRIVSVWDNPEDAEAEAAKYGKGYDSAFVEEYVMNNRQVQYPPLWRARLEKDGTITVSDKATAAVDVGDVRTEVWTGENGITWGHSVGVTPDTAKKNLIDAVAEHKAKLNNL